MKSFEEWVVLRDAAFFWGDDPGQTSAAGAPKIVAAGVLPIAQATGKICLNHRTNRPNNWIDNKSIDLSFTSVGTQNAHDVDWTRQKLAGALKSVPPGQEHDKGLHHLHDPAFREIYLQGCYGTIGGRLDGQQPDVAAKREVAEETGFNGPWVVFRPSVIWKIPVAANIAFQNFIGVCPNEFGHNPDEESNWETHGLIWVEYEEIAGRNGFKGIRFHDGLTYLLAHDGRTIQQLVAQCRAARTQQSPQQPG